MAGKQGPMRPPGQGQSKKARKRRRDRMIAEATLTRSAPRTLSRKGNKRWGFSLGGNLGPLTIPTVSFGSDTGQGKRNARAVSALNRKGMNTLDMISSNQGRMAIAPPALNPQVVAPKMVSGFDKQGNPVDVLCGTEFLSTITSKEVGNTQGAILFSAPINPSSFPLTRLAQFAPLYQRYRFRKLNFIYGAIAPETQAGQVIGFGDYDVDNMLTTDSPSNMNQAAAHIGERVNQVSEHALYPFGIRDSFTSLYTSLTEAEARLIYQGVFYLLAASSLPNNLQLGNIYLEYEIEFSINQLQVSAVDKLTLNSYCNGTVTTPPTITTSMLPSTLAFSNLGGIYSNNIVQSITPGGVNYNLPAGNYAIGVTSTQTQGSAAGGGTVQVLPNASAVGGSATLLPGALTTLTGTNNYVLTQDYFGILQVVPTIPGDTVLVTINPNMVVTGTATATGTSGYNYTQSLSSLDSIFPFEGTGPISNRAPKLITQNKRIKNDERKLAVLDATVSQQAVMLANLDALLRDFGRSENSSKEKGKEKCFRTILVPLSDSDDEIPS